MNIHLHIYNSVANKYKKNTLKQAIALLVFFVFSITTFANNIRVYGYVVDEENRGIELSNVYVKESVSSANGLIGTSTNKNGYYDLIIQGKDSFSLVFSMIGYQTIIQPVKGLEQDIVNINVVMHSDAEQLEELEVRGVKRTIGTLDEIEASTVRIMPDATGGSIESILITFTGVNQNNELSSQYNVRGGSFDENEVYVNGIEIHRPLLMRSGQQEGLSFVNPEMVDNVRFSAGGFGAQYGDKMSSVLDIKYKQPSKTEASISLSLLGASLYAGHGDSLFSQLHGIRYKTSTYMLGGLRTEGNYQPNYIDYQTYITWSLHNKKKLAEGLVKNKWKMSFLGNFSLNDYKFVPDSLSESFGTYQQTNNLNIWYDGQEKDRFITLFGAFSVNGNILDKTHEKLNIGFDASGFYTHERETYDITGQYILSQGGNANNGIGSVTGIQTSGGSDATVLGIGTYHEHARNTLEAGVITLSHNGTWQKDNNTLSWGISAQAELVKDNIKEWEWRDSAGYSLPNKDKSMDLYYSMRGDVNTNNARLQAYIHNTHTWRFEKGRLILDVGARLNWWSFTNEVLPSPRASIEFIPGWKRDIVFRIATGLYYQAPFYKEIRDTITDSYGVTRIHLNDKLKAQQSIHALIGTDYYFRAWGRPFKFTAEAYYKYINRMESYTVDNVRVRYSGKNDAVGYSTGLDLKIYGELVPGADSWINLSIMSAKHKITDHPEWGWLNSPQEQRYSFSMLFQDYFRKLPQLLFHIKFIYSDGLPFSAPRDIHLQSRMQDYRRIDIGATYSFNRKTAGFMRKPSAKHVKEWSMGLEVFNIVGWNNVNGYFWATDVYGNQWASPNYLTGRRINFKIRVDLQ